MRSVLDRALGQRVRGTRVVPLILKIVAIFTIFLLVSNFASNYVNLMLNRGEQVRLLNQLLVKDLKDLHVFAGNQFEIFNFTEDVETAQANLEESALRQLRGERSVALGIREDGGYFFEATHMLKTARFRDADAFATMVEKLDEEGIQEGSLNFFYRDNEYVGVYKYNERWDMFILRGEELREFYADSVRIFTEVSVLIVVITLVCMVVGILLIRYILRFVGVMTSSIMNMQDEQRLEPLDMSGAPNDDVTYLGIAFNSLASTIDNLMNIFKKFVARDVAAKAYREREIRLEGEKRELTILFSDIRSFTFMTETLGTDIITLLNRHYDRAIRHIHDADGDIGSIIGDALLAVFGAVDGGGNKSFQAVESAYRIQDVAASLRNEMNERRQRLLAERGELTEPEEAVYKAVLLQVGVGIDGGEVFYGNIGSNDRMVNTVIGDNVNSSSRLEGLTRFYQVPVICSEYVKREVTREHSGYRFLELDTVQVKGKTQGKRIYWPIPIADITDDLEGDLNSFAEGLELYYAGEWYDATAKFRACSLEAAREFENRVTNREPPLHWNGIWTMTEK